MDAPAPTTNPIAELFRGIVEGQAALHSLRCYPARLTFLIKGALKQMMAQPVKIGADDIQIEGISEVETVGDGRYAMQATDQLGNRYRIAVEVLPRSTTTKEAC